MLQALAEEEQLEALLIFLDFEKAFDRCSWDYLRDAIRSIGFPDAAPSEADRADAPERTEATDEPRYHPFLRWVQLDATLKPIEAHTQAPRSSKRNGPPTPSSESRG